MPSISLLLWCSLVVLAGIYPAPAAAKDSPAYTEAVTLGLSEFEAQNYAEARAHFARAHALYPNARTLRALGMVAFELKRYVECARYLTDALASNERSLEGEKRRQTEKLLERANGYIARFILDIAPDTNVIVDGVATDLAPGAELALEVGDHLVEFRASGRIASKRPVTVQGGERETLHVTLAALDLPGEPTPAQSPQRATPADRPSSRPAYKSPWLWTALGVLVAGAAAGTAVALTRGGTTTRTEEPYTGTGGAPALGTPR